MVMDAAATDKTRMMNEEKVGPLGPCLGHPALGTPCLGPVGLET
jgi:hypothetical protein